MFKAFDVFTYVNYFSIPNGLLKLNVAKATNKSKSGPAEQRLQKHQHPYYYAFILCILCSWESMSARTIELSWYRMSLLNAVRRHLRLVLVSQISLIVMYPT